MGYSKYCVELLEFFDYRTQKNGVISKVNMMKLSVRRCLLIFGGRSLQCQHFLTVRGQAITRFSNMRAIPEP